MGGDSSQDQLDALDRLAQLIADSPHNLVSRNERERVRTVHVEEARRVGRALAPEPGARWLDLGTGGGLPGLVLAVCYPDTRWALLDSTAKKVEAVRAFATALGLNNVEPLWGRAEELAWDSEHRGRYDGVISRAVASMPTLLELGRGFLRDGGLMAAIKGPRVEEELKNAHSARLSLSLGPFHRQDVSGEERPSVLVTMLAQGPPPRRYPRRTGIPATTPLGGVER